MPWVEAVFPFDLPGPEFLLFYLFFGIVTLLGLALLRARMEPEDAVKISLTDPYSIAFLRGGKNEVLRVATISLIDRGFLKATGSQLALTSASAPNQTRNPVEQAVLSFFSAPSNAASVFSAKSCEPPSKPYERQMLELGLLPDYSAKAARLRLFGFAVALLWSVAAIKIGVALAGGHKNIGFLIVLAILFPVFGYKVANPRLTGRGKALVKDMQSLFGSLKDRASGLQPGSNPTELALLAAVFGLASIPGSAFPHVKTLYPKAVASGGSGCGSSCGTSCGSSCGGGGCGGGCGGCGS